MLIVLALTPGAVAPPLSVPANVGTHGAAWRIGIATFPVFGSHVGSHVYFEVVPAAFAALYVIGSSEPPVEPPVVLEPDLPLLRPPRNTATSTMTSAIAMNGA